MPTRLVWRWVALGFLALILFPQIDIAVSGLFFDPVHQTFWLRSHPLGEFVRKQLPWLLFALALAVAVLGLVSWWRKHPVLGVGWSGATAAIAALALGPGLLVNLVLKDHWGRPRPSTITQFGGPNTYVPPLVPSDQCLDNCSFSSGHAALGFWMVSLALLAPAPLRPRLVAMALIFGAFVGFVRIAQGGHFLSDVAFSGLVVVAICVALHRFMLQRTVSSATEK
jgi:lipid A 4'-phosphatase